jgi:hypothetical protein
MARHTVDAVIHAAFTLEYRRTPVTLHGVVFDIFDRAHVEVFRCR